MYRVLFLCCGLAIACNNPQPSPDSESKAAIRDSLPANRDGGYAIPVSTDSAFRFIRNTFQQINAATLRKQEFRWEADGCNADGTAAYYFTSGNEIAKVVETGAIGDSYWTVAYYYKGGRFLFSLETNVGGPAAGPVDTFTIRKYAYNDKVIRTMRDETYTTPPDSVLTPASKEYRILQAYQDKRFSAAFCE